MNSFYSSLQKLPSRATVSACFCTETLTSRGSNDSLYRRVLSAADPRISVLPVLEKWVEEGKPVEKLDLQGLVKQTKVFRRYKHALEISMWMSDRRYFYLGPGDLADRLELLCKVHSLEHAENYFNNIPRQLKVFQTYGALLNCFAENKSIEKAEALFQEMKDLKICKSFAYNVIMKLYSYCGLHEKVDIVFQEMEEKGIRPDNFTFSILMDAYSIAGNMDGIEKLLKNLKSHEVVLNWHVYAVAAKGYMKAGLFDKALVALKKSEEFLPCKKNRIAYGFLLTLYADIGEKKELYRVWNLYKSLERASNSMYMCMLSGLLKLDDIEGAEAILEEWETQVTFYDFRVPNLLIASYCKKGLLGKAESYLRETIKSGRKPFANTWDRLALGYFEDNQTSKAVETLKKALVEGPSWWKPNPVNVSLSLEYFKGRGDVEAAEEFVTLLRRLVPMTREVYHWLLRTYFVARKPVAAVLDRMNEDGFEADEETQLILKETESCQNHPES